MILPGRASKIISPRNINLGLDLKGGSHLVMRVKTDDYLKVLTENNAQAALSAAKDAQLPVGEVSTVAENGTYSITLPVTDTARTQEVIDAVKQKVDFVNWTENASGNAVSWSLPTANQNLLKDQAVEQALRIIESRINAFGVKEPTLQRHGAQSSGQILLQMPGVDDPERVKNLIGADSNLALMKTAGETIQTFPTEEAARQSLGGTVPQNRRILPYSEDTTTTTTANQAEKPKQFIIVEYPAIVDGSELRDATAFSQTGGDSDYQIVLT
jgi:preprotein translocase subunit SecD